VPSRRDGVVRRSAQAGEIAGGQYRSPRKTWTRNPGLRFLALAWTADDGAFHDGVGVLTPTLFATLAHPRSFRIIV
jgi:hypothetical protein